MSDSYETVAIGYNARALGEGAVAVGGRLNGAGPGTEATGDGSVAVGNQSAAGGFAAVSLGYQAKAGGNSSIAIGNDAVANFDGSMAFGNGVDTTRNMQIAVGNGSHTYTFAGINSQGSKDAQDGAAYVVTSDQFGNIATSTFDFASLENAPERLDEAEADIVVLETNVTQNTTDIASHETRITNTETTVAGHETRLDGHDLVLADHETRITNNTTAITELDGRVTDLESSFTDLSDRISDNQDEARGGTALALAAAGLRFDDRPEKFSIAGGVGHFKGKTGLSLGFGYATSESLRFNAAVAGVPENGDVGFNAGMSWTLN